MKMYFNENDRVECEYMDIKFNGCVKSRRFHSINPNLVIYTIKPDIAFGNDRLTVNLSVDMISRICEMGYIKESNSIQTKEEKIKYQEAVVRTETKEYEISLTFGNGQRAKNIQDEQKTFLDNAIAELEKLKK